MLDLSDMKMRLCSGVPSGGKCSQKNFSQHLHWISSTSDEAMIGKLGKVDSLERIQKLQRSEDRERGGDRILYI